MVLTLDNLKPYKSYVLLQTFTEPSALDDLLVNDVADLLGERSRGDTQISILQNESLSDNQVGDLRVGLLHYEISKLPNWASDGVARDIVQELVLICRFERLIAAHCSEAGLAARLVSATKRADFSGLSLIQPIPEGRLNSAYVEGETATLWLSGTHRREVVKADNKVLSGLDLRYALDPLGDQTYHFTSVRSRPSVSIPGVPAVGVTPRRSKAWLGPSRAWAEFAADTERLLARLAAVEDETAAPLPILSVPVTSADLPVDAFDISLTDPETIAETGDMAADEREILHRWAQLAKYAVSGTQGHDFSVDVELDGESLGTLEFAMDTEVLPRAKFQVESQASDAQNASELLEEARGAFARRQFLNVWYESGHTVHDGAVFSIRHRDVAFDGYRWEPFSAADVKREKPDPIHDIGSQNSLFDWVLANWWDPSKDQWLACDDGSMEIADFILYEGSSPGLIELIHVKGANSGSLARGISVSAYEIVAGQAVKNLRFLDRTMLEEGLTAGMDRQVGDLVWHNRARSNRADLLTAMGSAPRSVQKSVVVIQPHVMRSRLEAARADLESSNGRRLRQLDTLLVGTQANVSSLGARFQVVAHDL